MMSANAPRPDGPSPIERAAGLLAVAALSVLAAAGCSSGAAGDSCDNGAECDAPLYCLRIDLETEGVCAETPPGCPPPLTCDCAELCPGQSTACDDISHSGVLVACF